MKNNNITVRTVVFAAAFLALALMLPFLTGQIPQIGSMLSPMHIPVLLCGFVCGWPWGLAVGVVAPPLRSVLFGMPPMYPTALCMAFELAAYGAVAGLMYRALPKKKSNIYVALITAMIAGRLVWGAARFLCTGLDPSKFGFAALLGGGVHAGDTRHNTAYNPHTAARNGAGKGKADIEIAGQGQTGRAFMPSLFYYACFIY